MDNRRVSSEGRHFVPNPLRREFTSLFNFSVILSVPHEVSLLRITPSLSLYEVSCFGSSYSVLLGPLVVSFLVFL